MSRRPLRPKDSAARHDVVNQSRKSSRSRVRDGGGGYALPMKLMRGAAALSAAKLVYDQARKPENQAKLKSAVAKAKESRTSRRK